VNQEEGKTIFFSNHVISEVEKICDNIIIISNGKIALEGTIQQIINQLPVKNTYSIGVEGINEAMLSQLPQVETISNLGNNMYTIKTNESYENETPEFLKVLVNMPSVSVHHFSKEVLNLEDIFLEVASNE